VIAKKGDGSLRDAQSIFDQIRSFCGNTITHADALKTLNAVDLDVYFRVTALIRERNQKGGIELVEEVIGLGYDLREFVGGLSEHFRNLLVVLSTGSADLLEASEQYRQKYLEESKQFAEGDLLRLARQANDLEQSIRWASQPRYKLEAALLQMIMMEKSVQVEELLKQIGELKKRLNGTIEAGGRPDGRSSVAGVPQGEVKVVGTVSAGHLRSAAASTVRRETVGMPPSPAFTSSRSSSLPSFSQPSSAPAVAAPAVRPGNGSTRSVSADETYARWQEWIGDVRKEKISVGAVLDESRLVDVSNGLIRISCPDEYHLSTIKRHKDYLVESFRKLTGYNVHIEPTVQAHHQQDDSSVTHTPVAAESRIPSSTNPHNQNHPVIDALKRELGAEPIE